MVKSHKDWIMKGYRYIYNPNHPSSHKGGLLDGRILEHRMLAEDMLGRPLLQSESVHHIDRNRLNNSPENLMILDEKSHSLLHKLEESGIEPVMDSIQFAHDGIGIQCVSKSGNDTNLAASNLRCLKCGKLLSHKVTSDKPKTGLCKDCYKAKISSHIPSREDLIEILRGKSMEEVGRQYKVTGKTIRKWTDKRGIDISGLTKPVGFSENARALSFTKKSRDKISESVRRFWEANGHPSNKPVEQIDSNGNVINSFESAVKASIAFGAHDGSPIVRACRHDSTYRGFKWRYK